MAGGPGNIIIRIGAETAGAVAGLKSVDKAFGDTMTKGQKATAGIKSAAVPAAAALGVLTAGAISAGKAAMEDADAQARLEGQLGRVTDATAKQIKGTDDWITKQSLATGIADDELRPALGKLATATGDLGEAQKELGLAMDLSAQTGKSLDSVTTALAKAHTGQFTALNRVIPGLDQAVLKTKDFTKVQAELASMSKGAASEAAQTNAGQMKVWAVQIQELKESLGAGLLPIMQSFMDLLIPATALIAAHTGAVKVAVGIIAALAGAVLAANAAIKVYEAFQTIATVATKAWTLATKAAAIAAKAYSVAQWLVNVALDANPIGAVVIALAALTAGFIVAYKTSGTFRALVAGAFNAVKDAAAAAWNFITSHWKLALFAFGPIGAAVYVIVTHFNELKSAAEAAFKAITDAVGAVKKAIQGVIDLVERLISAIGRIHFPHIPDLNPFMAAPASARGSKAAAGATVGGGITVNVYGAVDPEGTARAIRRVLAGHDRRQGRTIGGLY